MEKVPGREKRFRREEIIEAYAQGYAGAQIHADLLRRCVQKQRCAAAFQRRGAVICLLRRRSPPSRGSTPTRRRKSCARGDPSEEPLERAGFQDHDRSFRRAAGISCGCIRGSLKSGSYTFIIPPRISVKGWGGFCSMHANKREEVKSVKAGDIAAAIGLKSTFTGDTLCRGGDHPVILESISFPGACHLRCDRAQDQGGAGQAVRLPRQASAGRPHLQRQSQSRHQPDRHLRYGRAAP